MQQLLFSIQRLYKEEGINILTREIAKHIFLRAANFVTPSETHIEVDGISATFDTQPDPQLTFRHDLRAERPVINQLINDIQSDDIFFDIGANIGLFSSFVGKQLSSEGEIVAFDPNPSALPKLYQNLGRNCEDYDVYAIGLGELTTFGRMSPEFSTAAHISEASGICIRVERLDSLISDDVIPTPTAVKIDVEGAELRVLEGFGESLSDVELMYIEAHSAKGGSSQTTQDAVNNLLSPHFDKIDLVEAPDQQVHVRARSSRR